MAETTREGFEYWQDLALSNQRELDQLRQRVAEANDYAERCTEANRQAELDNDELRAKLALAEQDARRLDNLERIFLGEGTAGGYALCDGGLDISIEVSGKEFVGKTLRDAIDRSQETKT